MRERLTRSGWLSVLSSSSLFEDPSELREFATRFGLTSLVVVGARSNASLMELARAAESESLPGFAIQTVSLQVYHQRQDGLLGETWALAAMAHAKKAASASYASRAKKLVAREMRVGRRELFFSLPGLLGKVVEDPIMVPERCSPFHRACRHCSDACAYSAITHDGPTASVDSTKCVHCGACAAVCPTGALQSPIFSDDEYRAFLREFALRSAGFSKPLAVFTCDSGISMLEAEAKSGMGLQEGMVAVRSPCAAALGWPHYLWAASAGVPVLCVCPSEELTRHPEVAGSEERARAAAATLRGSYKTLVGHRTLRPSEKMSEACDEASRRAIRRANVSLTPSGSRTDAILAVPLSVVSDEEVRLPGLNTFDVLVDDKCTLCGACSQVCPVKAFRITNRDGNMELRFHPGQCTGCGICVEECPEEAMRASRAFSSVWLDPKGFAVKALGRVELCKKCGRPIGSRASLKKLHDSLNMGGQPALAESVYLCQDCKGGPAAQT
jgi:ferredoxin